MISIKNINKFYNKGRSNELHVLKDVSLELPEKGIVALFGRSGCGKSTLFNLIGGLDRFNSGSVFIDNQDIKKDTDVIRNKYIGYIFQNYYLNNNLSCYENVAQSLRLCGMEDENTIEELVVQALKNVGMEKYIKRTPDTLSGGQQQRIAIARAIVKNPRIILADEPTGNLDDNNTILVMDLLKEISKDHLVLLITHEEKLVDYYCDKVINISDGQINKIYENGDTQGLNSKNKNDIYLGDLEKVEEHNDLIKVDYYGEKTNNPINIRIVNIDGNIYLKVDSKNIKIIDKSSEIKLKEGKFVQKVKKERTNEIIINDIPLVEDKKYGKLFTFKSSLKNGLKNLVFKQKKKLEKGMYNVLFLFSIVTVIFASVFGTAFKSIEEVNNNVDSNIFYVRASDDNISEIINQGSQDSSSGFTYNYPLYNQGTQGTYLDFRMASFETSKPYYGQTRFESVYLSNVLLENKKLLAGKKTELLPHEIVVSSQLADKIIKESSYGSVQSYNDLIGWFCPTISYQNKDGYIVGVVQDNNNGVYINPNLLSDIIISNSQLPIKSSSKYDLEINQGEVVYLEIDLIQDSNIQVGKEILINGKSLTIKEIKVNYNEYDLFLSNVYSGIDYSENAYFDDKIKEVYPSLSEEQIKEDYQKYYSEIKNKYYYDYLDFYYTNYDAYLENIAFFGHSNFSIWMYLVKNYEIAKYYTMTSGIVYYAARDYKKIHGQYPTLEESNNIDTSSYYSLLNYIEDSYEEEFYASYYTQQLRDQYVLNDEDYYQVARQSGKTSEIVTKDAYQYVPKYILIHSDSPEKTQEWLTSNIEKKNYDDGYSYLVTPNDVKEIKMQDIKASILSKIVAIIVLTIIMSLCMYFIMKASVMNRIKEIGIYRAIGVSKKNFIFKFTIETLVLISSTILIGYLLSSGVIALANTLSPSIGELLYYPWYVSLPLLILLYGITLVCGLLPVIALLKRTPSEILAKYDI